MEAENFDFLQDMGPKMLPPEVWYDQELAKLQRNLVEYKKVYKRRVESHQIQINEIKLLGYVGLLGVEESMLKFSATNGAVEFDILFSNIKVALRDYAQMMRASV